MIQSHHFHLQWKFKLWVGKFAWDVKAQHCWALSTNYLYSKVCWQHPAMFCLYTFPAHNLNFHWRWRWRDRIQAIFINLFYFSQHPIHWNDFNFHCNLQKMLRRRRYMFFAFIMNFPETIWYIHLWINTFLYKIVGFT